MAGTINLSSVISAMNSAAGDSRSSAAQGANESQAGAAYARSLLDFRSTNASTQKGSGQDVKLRGVTQPNEGKAKWNDAQKPITKVIEQNMQTPDIATQDSLLAMMDANEQKYVLFTYDLLKQQGSNNG